MLNMLYNNEAVQVFGPIPPLINNLIYEGDKAMTSRTIPQSNPNSQDVKLCACGCGEPVNIYHGKLNKYVGRHGARCVSKETRQKLSKASMNHIVTKDMRIKISEGNKKQNKKVSIETRIRMSLAKLQLRSDGYCEVWGDREYRDDLRGNVCEECGITNMMNIKLFERRLSNHHTDGNKQNCNPSNFTTLCTSCHAKEDYKLRKQKLFNL